MKSNQTALKRWTSSYSGPSLWLPQSIELLFKNEIEQVINSVNHSAILLKQDLVNGLDNTLTAWLFNDGSCNLFRLNSWANGIDQWQKMYSKYLITKTTYYMHIVNYTTTQMTLVGLPSNVVITPAAPVTFGVLSTEIDFREFPGARRIHISPLGSGNNSATLKYTVRTSTVLGNKTQYTNNWWGPFSPLDNPTEQCYMNWFLFLTGAYSSAASGYTLQYAYKETVISKVRLFGRKDPREMPVTIGSAPDPAESEL